MGPSILTTPPATEHKHMSCSVLRRRCTKCECVQLLCMKYLCSPYAVAAPTFIPCTIVNCERKSVRVSLSLSIWLPAHKAIQSLAYKINPNNNKAHAQHTLTAHLCCRSAQRAFNATHIEYPSCAVRCVQHIRMNGICCTLSRAPYTTHTYINHTHKHNERYIRASYTITRHATNIRKT